MIKIKKSNIKKKKSNIKKKKSNIKEKEDERKRDEKRGIITDKKRGKKMDNNITSNKRGKKKRGKEKNKRENNITSSKGENIIKISHTDKLTILDFMEDTTGINGYVTNRNKFNKKSSNKHNHITAYTERKDTTVYIRESGINILNIDNSHIINLDNIDNSHIDNIPNIDNYNNESQLCIKILNIIKHYCNRTEIMLIKLNAAVECGHISSLKKYSLYAYSYNINKKELNMEIDKIIKENNYSRKQFANYLSAYFEPLLSFMQNIVACEMQSGTELNNRITAGLTNTKNIKDFIYFLLIHETESYEKFSMSKINTIYSILSNDKLETITYYDINHKLKSFENKGRQIKNISTLYPIHNTLTKKYKYYYIDSFRIYKLQTLDLDSLIHISS